MGWGRDGCDLCRRSVLAAGWKSLTLLADSIPRHARLWRCEICGAFWEESEREAHVVSEDAARRDFPEGFASPD